MKSKLAEDIAFALNCSSAENGSDTPDFILAQYLLGCLAAYDAALVAREKWYGRECGGHKGPWPVDVMPVVPDPEECKPLFGPEAGRPNECKHGVPTERTCLMCEGGY